VAVALLLVLLAAFFRRVTHPVRGAPWLWLATLVSELWLALAWLIAQLPKLSLTDRETHLDSLASRYDDKDGEGELSRLGSVDALVTVAGAGRRSLRWRRRTRSSDPVSARTADYLARRLACYVSDDGADMVLHLAPGLLQRLRRPIPRRAGGPRQRVQPFTALYLAVEAPVPASCSARALAPPSTW
jgi:cellulose synthase A